jgi:uncharacterized protein
MPIAVTRLATAAVKGTRLRDVDRIELDRHGAHGDRRFFVIDARNRMLNGKQLGELHTVVVDYHEDARKLAFTFPAGQVVEDHVELGATVTARFYARAVEGRLVRGPWSEALSELANQPLRLVESATGAVDRGSRGAVSLVSRASLARLAEVAAESDVDGRRFRMLIEIDGVGAHQEDEWVGRTVRIGAARLRFLGNVGRCLVTSRDPETGQVDLPTLDILGSYRYEMRSTEPLPFGIYGEVREEGPVAVGDIAAPVD